MIVCNSRHNDVRDHCRDPYSSLVECILANGSHSGQADTPCPGTQAFMKSLKLRLSMRRQSERVNTMGAYNTVEAIIGY